MTAGTPGCPRTPIALFIAAVFTAPAAYRLQPGLDRGAPGGI